MSAESSPLSVPRLGASRRPADLPPPIESPKPLHEVRLAPPFDACLPALPEEVAAIPSMMSVGERRFLFGIARDYYTGAGLIVDAGIFLGGSTMCLGSGLCENVHLAESVARWQQPIISCELGITNEQMLLSFKRHGIGEGLRIGDSFGPVLERHIASVRHLIDLRLGDITELGRIEDPNRVRRHPVEILFLDVLKSPELSEFAFREYFPRLIPRRSLVVQQDYLNGDLPFIHVHQEYFAKKFEYVGELSSSAVFRLVHRITPEEVDALFTGRVDPEAQLTLGAMAGQRSIDPFRRLIMTFSILRLLMRARGADAARAYLDFVETSYAAQIAETRFRRVQNVVRAARFLCEHGLDAEQEAVKISTGHRGSDHRRTDLPASLGVVGEGGGVTRPLGSA